METSGYVEPAYEKTAFNCPFCNAYSSFRWETQYITAEGGVETFGHNRVAQCSHCSDWTMWNGRVVFSQGNRLQVKTVWTMIHPSVVNAPLPNNDMPEECKGDYLEARQVLGTSPRAAAALLRLCIQKLCAELGEPGENINTDIGSLVNKGLDSRVQKALDIVRITGNNAVHPGEMDIQDSPEIAAKLFKLTNLIVDEMITKPRELDDLYEDLPTGALEQISRRDGVSQ
jgi:Domain of unknown function (DUF4145)